MQLVRIKHWGSAALEVAHGGAFFRHDQGAFKLPGIA